MKFKMIHVLFVCSFSVAMSYAAEKEEGKVGAERAQERKNAGKNIQETPEQAQIREYYEIDPSIRDRAEMAWHDARNKFIDQNPECKDKEANAEADRVYDRILGLNG